MTSPDQAAALTIPATYDREADALYVYLQPTIEPDEVTSTVAVRLAGDTPGLLLELDAAGRLVGLEVLHATTILPADLLQRALPAGPATRPAAP